MFTQIKTSKANKLVVTDLSRKFNLGAENTIARIAIAYSLSKGDKMNLANISDSQGKEYSKNVLFGSYYPFYISLICVKYGLYKTDKDISNWGTILTVALIVGLILTIINFFVGSSMLDIALDWAMLFIFFGLTIYDMNKITEMHNLGFCDDEKLYVYGAMELYLDFINIFLRILALFGKRKD
mgnify:CR=1 FL=1